jgi:hypothetical protein
MGFRRTKVDALQARDWRRFLEANASLLASTGLPESIYSSQEVFDDFLMHGCIDHHPDPTGFRLEQMSPDQLRLLSEAVVRYLQAGFLSPHIGGFPEWFRSEIVRRTGVKP